MKILTDKYFKKYLESLSNFIESINNFKLSSKDLDFDYLTESSSIFSANIEGNGMDLNSFMNSKFNKKTSKDISEIKNLIESYQFAQKNKLNEVNFLKVHSISTKSLLIKSNRGIYRADKVGVFSKGGLVYLAIEPEFVKQEMNKLFKDIEYLLNKELSQEEIFYYSSFIHLIFVQIHPFSDGNGRCARILEKWFLCEKLGNNFWKLRSEQYYKENRNDYYKNINLGVNYYEINYDNSMNFLIMLTESLKL